MNRTRIAALVALLLLVDLSFLGCQSAAQEPTLRERIRERMAARKQQDAPATEGETDVSEKITKSGDHTFTIEHDGLKRSYIVHVPPKYDPAHPTPLLVSL